ncbi:MAG: amidase [Roseivirga sp.]|jgi:Asp-tRNA(Asn)/Glu-tRNA(Gln) amidotransferase A subunit family amidase|uniref:amidase n=1 Tax=Roseivirga sp. TaxID=1964215 RepID=UPI001B08D8FB|nr:amidase [Roseivirga sp.]MBO6497170.1 amidase [Roseivirga sp.]
MLKRTIVLLLAISLAISCKPTQYGFRTKDIKSAQRLYGLEFDKAGIDTMYHYLGRNKRGYENLREYQVDNETFPALTFNPHPSGFEMPTGQQQILQSEVSDNIVLPATDEEIAFLNIPELASLIKARKITSEQLTNIYLERIEKHDGQLQSVITVTKELALKQARKADKEIAAGNYKGILHGIPYGVKDLMAVEGYPTTWGAEPYKDQMIDHTATVVNKLTEQGAVLIAKLVSGSLARGDVWFGGKTKNPWDLSQGASGSSAGSGSATSAGLVAFSLGTETLGSITSPATRNGVTGLRPTYGRISRHGVMSLSWSMDKVGPICRSAEDCEIVLAAIYGMDPLDPTTNNVPFTPANGKVSNLKIAKLESDILSDSKTQRGKNVMAAVALLEKELNSSFDTLSLPKNYPFRVFDIILRAEAGAFFEELVRSGAVDDMVEQTSGSRANSLRQARFIPAVEYLQANRERRRLIEEIHQLFKNYDVIIAPSARSSQLQITNLTGHPVISIPTGFDEKGRPTSLTLIGNLYEEDKILQLAKYYQSLTEFDEKHPPLFYPLAK